MTIGKRIREARKKAGLSQEALARAINSTKQAVYKYECDIVTNIPMDKIEIMSNVLSVTPSYLMGWEDDNVYHCPDDENPWILKINEIMEKADLDTQIEICHRAEAISNGTTDQLTEQEKTLLRLFRETSEEGKMRMIQSVLNIHDAAEKSSVSSGITSLA